MSAATFTVRAGQFRSQAMRRPLVGLSILALLIGCEAAPTPPTTLDPPPIGVELMRAVPELRVLRFSTLLDFESDVDAVFVVAPGGGARLVEAPAHTGRRVLQLTGASPVVELKLSSLLTGRVFPGKWALVGVYVRSDAPSDVRIELLDGERPLTSSTVRPVPATWTAAMLDLSNVPAEPSTRPTSEYRLRLSWRGAGPLLVDDVMLVDNTQQLLDGGAGGMSVRKRGMKIVCEHPGRFAVSLDMLEGNPAGWTVEEVSPVRARFAGGGKTRSLVIYDNGLSYWDGTPRSLFGMLRLEDGWQRQHEAPARLVIGQTPGRVLRTTTGDADNDGYNELTGAYQVEAEGPRLELTIEPREQVISPVLEIVGLPPGKLVVTVEGRLVESHARLPDGRALIIIPLKLQRPASVLVRVQ
jgi:hypothetical protein